MEQFIFMEVELMYSVKGQMKEEIMNLLIMMEISI